MAEQQPRPILITGAGRRIGLALAHHAAAPPVIVAIVRPIRRLTACAKRARGHGHAASDIIHHRLRGGARERQTYRLRRQQSRPDI